ncbi:alpha/beta fold hydrolase [Amycolatopsis anabasis]|uniref:alpha/beta fold hydrolase n=1 Tax=Amycolatopsis anabasis TaxID=1840409 RepID=UPI00131A9F12|nr:alpha/beta hydrolase [Amycolatopsis anabasis]
MGTRGFGSIELRNGPIEYRWIDGDPALPPLVFLHEGLGCVALWSRFPEWAARATGRAALVYSRYGYGSSAPAKAPRPVGYLHEEADRVLPELLTASRIDRPVLIGHSDGASIALLHAASHPVSAVVALAPHVFVEPETLAGITAATDAYRAGSLARRLARYHDDPDGTFWSWAEVWLSPEFRDWNLENLLPGIDRPVLLIQGEQDQYGTVRQLEAIERGVSGPVKRVELADCGHAPHLAHPGTTVAAVADFLGGLSGLDHR